jgi:hypothetical protein
MAEPAQILAPPNPSIRSLRARTAARTRSALSAAAEPSNRGEMNVEVVRGSAKCIPDRTSVFRRDVLDGEAHVRRKLAPAASAERVPHRLVEVATGASRFLRESGNLIFRKVHPILRAADSVIPIYVQEQHHVTSMSR